MLLTLELAFADRPLRQLCESEATAKRRLGPELARELKACLADLAAAPALGDLPSPPVLLPTAGRAEWTVPVGPSARLQFRSNHAAHQHGTSTIPDATSIRRIKIVAFTREP